MTVPNPHTRHLFVHHAKLTHERVTHTQKRMATHTKLTHDPLAHLLVGSFDRSNLQTHNALM